jgi:hypothetical protein
VEVGRRFALAELNVEALAHALKGGPNGSDRSVVQELADSIRHRLRHRARFIPLACSQLPGNDHALPAGTITPPTVERDAGAVAAAIDKQPGRIVGLFGFA